LSSKILVDEISGKTSAGGGATIDSNGFVSIVTALTGKSAVYGWNAVNSTTVSHNTITVLNLSTTNHASHKVTVASNNRLTPTVAGRYFCFCNAQASGTGSAGFTPITYFYKNGSSWSSNSGIRNYAGSCTLDFPIHFSVIHFNGTSDYLQLAVYQNTGNSFTANGGCIGIIRLGD
jgi:hypothetical protein